MSLSSSVLNFAITQSVVNIFYWNCACRQRYNKYETYQTWILIEGLCPTPWVDLGGGGPNSTFSEHGHVAYQIKGNHDCNNMAANILQADHHPPPIPPGPQTNWLFRPLYRDMKFHHRFSNFVILFSGPFIYLLEKADRFIYKTCPFVAGGIFIGSVYWTAVTYGAVTVMQVCAFLLCCYCHVDICVTVFSVTVMQICCNSVTAMQVCVLHLTDWTRYLNYGVWKNDKWCY